MSCFGFHRRVARFPGVSINLSRAGSSTSIGVRGASLKIGAPGRSHLCALIVAVQALVTMSPVQAEEAWELRRPGATVVVEGDRALAERTMKRVLLIQETARLVLGRPKDFQPRPVIVFAIGERLTRRVFSSPEAPAGAAIPDRVQRGQMLSTPTVAAIAVPLKNVRGHELDTLQYAYGSMLMREAPTATWPECAQLGFGIMFTAAAYTLPSHLYIGTTMVSPLPPLDPKRFLLAESGDEDQLLRDRRAYSCYLLAHMYAIGSPEVRASIADLYASVGAGAALDTSIPAGLGGTLEQFAGRFHDFAEFRFFHARDLDVTSDLPLPTPLADDASAIEPVRMEALLNQLCGKLGSCRAPH
jgi:hypothetical protein